MFTSQAIFTMIVFLFAGAVVSYGFFIAIKSKFKISGLKVMLLGLGLIAFSNAVLKGMLKGDADTTIALIGFSILLSGFFIKEK